MKHIYISLFLLAVTMVARAQYQVPNSDFEAWESVSYGGTTGDEPVHWSSFINASGKFASTVRAIQLYKETEVRPGSEGQYSAKLTARKVLGSIIAQGNMTTGQINGGSMTASDANGNYNWTNVDDPDFCCPFTGRPDAMRVWVRFYGGNSTYPEGKISALLHGNGYYQDPNSGNTGSLCELVAQAYTTTVSNETWTEYTVPFTYSSKDTPAYALVSFSTNSNPGSGTTGDYMYVDDMEMLYYSDLAKAAYNGEEVVFTESRTAQVDAIYNERFLKLTPRGNAATVERSMDEETFLLTVTVKGGNYSEDETNVTTYTIQFAGIKTDADDESDAIVTPETEITPAIPGVGCYYIVNRRDGRYMGPDNSTTTKPHVWFVSTDDGTPIIYDADGHHLRIWRSGTGLNYKCMAVTNSDVAETVTLWRVGDTDSYIIGNNLHTGVGKWTDRYFAVDDAFVIYDGDATSGESIYWQFIDVAQSERVKTFWAGYAKASTSNGVDATSWLKNAECSFPFGWEGDEPTIQDGVGEQWNKTYDMYQTVTGLPLGLYRLEVQGFYRDAEYVTAEAEQLATLYVGDYTMPLSSIIADAQPEALTESDTHNNPHELYVPQRTFGAVEWFRNGYYANATELFYLPSLADLTVGIRKAADISRDWTCFDNWRLTYYGRLDFSLQGTTYAGQSLEGVTAMEDVIYEPEQLKVTLGNGAQEYATDYDEETHVLTIVISGYGRSKTHEIQFGDPDVVGVEEVELGDAESLKSRNPGIQKSAYNLAGQRVDARYHGIIIRDGHKVLR